MYRVYLDTNVFNKLKDLGNTQIDPLRQALKKYSLNLHYVYSHAHLLDLQRDKGDSKFDDLKYLETWVGNSYIIQYYGEKRANCHSIVPRRAFEQLEPADRLEGKFKIDDIFTGSPEMELAGQMLRSTLENQRLDFSEDIIEKQPEYIQPFYKRFFDLTQEGATMLDAVNRFTDMYKSVATDDKSFRELRRIIIEGINPAMDKVRYDEDFNNALKDTHIKKTFREYVLGSLHKKDPTIQDVFLHAYMCLNILGIDQEINKKARFLNTIADSFHSYYGAHCDCIVSMDEGFLRKTHTIYKLFDIQTSVFSLSEFAAQVDGIGTSGEISSLESFYSSLEFDIQNGFVVSQGESGDVDSQSSIVKLTVPYFHFFTHFEQIFLKGKGTYLSLFKSLDDNLSRFYFFKEIAEVVDKLVSILGPDDYFKAGYVQTENQEILAKKWRGRVWNSSILLGFTQSGRLSLQLGPIPSEPLE